MEEFKSGKKIELKDFSDYVAVKQGVGEGYEKELSELYEEACSKFPILVLCDLNGTLCYREKTKRLKHMGVTKPHDLKYKAF